MNILIVGIRKKETVKLKSKGKKISFIFSDSITSKAFNKLGKYNYIISMTKFSSHLTEYLCNTHPGFIRMRPTQGISTINSILDSLK